MELPQSFIDEGVRGMFDAARQKQAQRAAMVQEKLAQQQAMLDEQRIVKQAEVDQLISELSDDEKKFPAVMHDIGRERAINDADYMRRSATLRLFGRPTGEIERELKNVEKNINERFGQSLKDFEETEQFKVAKENASKLQDVNQRINLVTSAVNTGKDLLDKGDKVAALQHMRTNVIKPLNSILSNDAIQLSEMLIRYRDLINAPEAAQLANKSAFNPTVWMNQYMSQKDETQQQAMLEGLKDQVEDVAIKAFKANPERFLVTAVNGVNSYMSGHNKMVQERVINTSSPGVAERLGAKMFKPIELAPPPPQMPQVFPGANIPFGSQPVQGGSTQMPAPSAAPASQPTRTVDDILRQYKLNP
jgi:hypothetical protein